MQKAEVFCLRRYKNVVQPKKKKIMTAEIFLFGKRYVL
jgi:hypothetical protein